MDTARNAIDPKNPSRRWLYGLMSDADLVDTYRYFHPRRRQYTHWSQITGARANNFGSRIDMILGSSGMVRRFSYDAGIKDKIQGSDHCPVYLDVVEDAIAKQENDNPPECRYSVRFAGQKRIHSFFRSSSSSQPTSDRGNSKEQPKAPQCQVSSILEWTCSVCTYINKKSSFCCEVCTQPNRKRPNTRKERQASLDGFVRISRVSTSSGPAGSAIHSTPGSSAHTTSEADTDRDEEKKRPPRSNTEARNSWRRMLSG
eukprot:CAMPEP_0167830710 /NCGR_PEP_ID=MMETSP0112_2-20121227/13125_1 /TAXON_ID=91324 /ORGANISM="Lotharella globosa, Strain CCCM811" /LENGTH=257 /DNA_ID=CAMNT_0007735063 /DNA_START=194 /DNA_END=963 /DNA_ORIENTATION=-